MKLDFLLQNKDLLSYIVLQVGTLICLAVQKWGNLEYAKKEAIIRVEEYIKNSEVALSSADKINKAVSYFYDLYLTKGISGSIIKLFMPKDKVIRLIEAELVRIQKVGRPRLLNKLSGL